MLIVQALFGIAAILALAWAISENRREVNWRPVIAGIGLQFAFALLLLKVPVFQTVFLWLNDAVAAIEEATLAGTRFVFGFVGGGATPYEVTAPQASFSLAFQSLPIILVISALSALLFYWRILPIFVRGFAWLLRRTMGVGGAVGMGSAASIFMGTIEAPLLIRPYLLSMSRGELFMIMTAGMSTIAGTVLVLFATFLEPVIPNPVGHLLTASIISAPAAVAVAILMVPTPSGPSDAELITPEPEASSTMDAISRGALDGMTLLIQILAMLIVFVALVALIDQILAFLPQVAGEEITLSRLFGWVLAPLAWLMGIPWEEAQAGGSLLGIKVVLNELLAYREFGQMDPDTFSERTRLILTYALCGFANFGSLGIMIGGIGAMAPERRGEVIQLGLRSILSGTLATCLTGAVVGIIY